MGTGNYSYSSPILCDDHSEQYNLMVYVDEWGYARDEDLSDFDPDFQDSIREDIRSLLLEYLNGFTEPCYRYQHDVCRSSFNSHEELLGECGRMAVIAAPTYYGDRIALVVTPNAEWQEKIHVVLSDNPLFPERKYGLIDWQACTAAERARWASAIRSIEGGGLHREMQAFAANFLVGMEQTRLEFYSGDRSLFERYGIEEEISLALKRHVALKSGGYLIIDQTEAMTTIDVNTGAFVGKLSQDDTIYKTNLEAARAIARQLRLRNLGGIIMLDFIDMNDPVHQQGVMDALLAALAGDRSKYTISPISPLGIIEMTRKRTRESLRQLMCEPCPCCQGRGYVKTVETITYELFRDLMREARDFSPKTMTIVAGLELIDFIREEESLTFSDLQALLKIPIRLQVDSAYRHGQYDIALG